MWKNKKKRLNQAYPSKRVKKKLNPDATKIEIDELKINDA